MSRNAPDKQRWSSAWRRITTATLFLGLATVVGAFDLSTPVPSSSHPLVVVHDPGATVRLQAQPKRVETMVDRAVQALTGTSSAKDAWRTFVTPEDVVAIKVFSSLGPNTGTRLPVVKGVIDGLLLAGVQPTNIIVWDRLKTDLLKSGFGELARQTGVSLQGAVDAGYDELDSYSFALLTGLRPGDLEFGDSSDGAGRRSFVTRILGPRVTKIISITPASNKHSTGVTGHLYSMTMGAMDNTWRFESNPSTLPRVVPELYAKRSIGDRVILCITDALICQYEGEEKSLLHYSAVANEIYVGTDPVALDLLAIQTLEKQRRASEAARLEPDMEIYRIAALLQLGVDDLERVDIRRLSINREDPATPTESPNDLRAPAQP